MNKLLKAGFSRLLQNRLYVLGLLFSAGISVFAAISRYTDIQQYPEVFAELGPEFRSVEGFAFSLVIAFMFAMTVVNTMFLGTEYADGTMRNKIIAGHKRFDIYAANYFICTAANLSMVLIGYLTAFGIGRLLLPDSYLSTGEILLNCLSSCATVLGFTAILVLIAMLVQSKAGAAVTSLILTMLLYIAVMVISDSLLQPEYKEVGRVATFEDEGDHSYQDVQIISEKNPKYLTGIKREIYEQLDQLLPFNQIVRISDGRASGHLELMTFYSLLTFLLFNGLGLFFFRKKDLK